MLMKRRENRGAPERTRIAKVVKEGWGDSKIRIMTERKERIPSEK